jgi:hypothetical protein
MEIKVDKKFIIILGMLTLLSSNNNDVGADIYSWVDEKGVKHFSNSQPSPDCGAEVELKTETNFEVDNSQRNKNVSSSIGTAKEIEKYKKPSPAFKLNDGIYDSRFASPEKTYSLYKKLLLAGDLKNVTECFMPNKAEQFYNLFKKLLKVKKLEEFARNLPNDIHLESNLDPYYHYAMIAEQDGEKFSFLVKFIKIPSGIFLLDGM